MRKELESGRKLLILPELLWHTLWEAHPLRESNSAHKLLGGEPGPSQASALRGGCRPTVHEPPGEETLKSQSCVHVSDPGTS